MSKPFLTAKLSPEAQSVIKRLGSTTVMFQNIAKALDLQNELTVSHIIQNRTRGNDGTPFEPSLGILGVRTGTYRRRLRRNAATITGDRVSSAIGSNLAYAAIHEFGGRTAPHIIEPKRKNGSLAFQIGGRTVFAKMVKHPGSRIPARAPVRRGIEDRLPDYQAALSKAVIAAWSKEGQA